MFLKMAWRNMWRSRRRTLITISSILFAVVLAIVMRETVMGMFETLISDTVRMSCGYIQVHRRGYWENKSVDSSFEPTAALVGALNREPGVRCWTPHLESFALASSGQRSKGALITGIDPALEDSASGLAEKVVAGRYLSGTDSGILLAQGLAEYLRLSVGDTVVLLGQGFEGNMAAGKYRVEGIAALGIPDMNKSMAWLPMKACQDFLGTGNRCTGISLILARPDDVAPVQRDLGHVAAAEGYEVMTWQEMVPELDQLFRVKMAQNTIMSGVLYLVIAFGIFGTILMMLNERAHEFGILIAIGMRKGRLATLVVVEMALMSVVGALSGILAAVPVIGYFRVHPIRLKGSQAELFRRFNLEPVIRPAADPLHFIQQGYTVLALVLALSLFSVFHIRRINVSSTINS